MSYDLLFYKRKASNLTIDQIVDYLSNKLVPVNDNGTHWLFENKDTEVYYSFEINEPEEGDTTEEQPEWLEDFENTNISFNLNFIRPSFFGLEAFNFIVRFIKDLDLFVVNPQGENDAPYKPTKESLFDNWNKTNIWASKEHSGETSFYYPADLANAVWEHNYNRQFIQEELGEEYFVSKAFFFKQLHSNKIVTLSMWTEHIPNVLPITDYYLLGKQYKKLFRTVKEMVLLSKNEFDKTLGIFFEPYTFQNAIIIRPDKAVAIEKIFNSAKSDLDFKKNWERVTADSIVNSIKGE